MDGKDLIARELAAARTRSLDLLEPLPEADLLCQHSPLMSPLVWDLAHVGNYEDQWLLGAVGAGRVGAHLDDVYDAFRHPRRDRPALPMLSPDEARRYLREVRGRVLDRLEATDLEATDPLVQAGFVYGMVVQHEHQHDETMLATLQLRGRDGHPLDGEGPRPLPVATDAVPAGESREVRVGGGPFVMGTDLDPWAYDNERPAHLVELPPYWIDRTPVTNAAYLAFVDDHGYQRPELWTRAGWAWCRETELVAPQFWSRTGPASWSRTRFGRIEPLPLDEPVQHVCWFEADAYARWAGRRLPTEAEWEMAASVTPEGTKRRYPWGDDAPTPRVANLWQGRSRLAPAPVTAPAALAGASPWGCRQLIGDVWEWTASDFLPYPGFIPFPYREYSEVFYGSEYKVLRGGSWATHPTAIRTTFRNWDYPIRRQIFAGFRTARDDG